MLHQKRRVNRGSRELQCNHAGVSAARSTIQKSSSWTPNVIGNRSRSHPRVPVPNTFALGLMSGDPRQHQEEADSGSFHGDQHGNTCEERTLIICDPPPYKKIYDLFYNIYFHSLVILFLGELAHTGGSSHLLSYPKSQILSFISADEPYFPTSYENLMTKNDLFSCPFI